MRSIVLFLVTCVASACTSSTDVADRSTIPRHFREAFPIALAASAQSDKTPSGDNVLAGTHIMNPCGDCAVLYDGKVSLGYAIALHEHSSDATMLIVWKYGTPDGPQNALHLARQRLIAEGMIAPPFEGANDGRSVRFTYDGIRDGKRVRGIVMMATDPNNSTISLLMATEYPADRQEAASRMFLRYAAAIGMPSAP